MTSYSTILDRYVMQMDYGQGYKCKGRFEYRCIKSPANAGGYGSKILGAMMRVRTRNTRYGHVDIPSDMTNIVFVAYLDGTARYNRHILGQLGIRCPTIQSIKDKIAEYYTSFRIVNNVEHLRRKPIATSERIESELGVSSLGQRLIDKYNT